VKSTNRRCSTCKKKVPAEEAIIGALKAFCSYDCLKAYTQSERGQKVVRAAKRQDLKEKKDKLKTARDYIKDCQTAVNAYVRYRDEGKPCISCGNLPQNKLGGTMDAGHYRSRGSASHLRFNTLNIHAQCVKCNRYHSGAVTDFRLGLIRKIGLDLVEALESDNTPRKFTVQYLQRCTAIFRKRLRILKKIRNNNSCN
jgi:endogenous inhibitor of DNA gyrase (YacG/DUF329 family)